MVLTCLPWLLFWWLVCVMFGRFVWLFGLPYCLLIGSWFVVCLTLVYLFDLLLLAFLFNDLRLLAAVCRLFLFVVRLIDLCACFVWFGCGLWLTATGFALFACLPLVWFVVVTCWGLLVVCFTAFCWFLFTLVWCFVVLPCRSLWLRRCCDTSIEFELEFVGWLFCLEFECCV